MKSIIISSNSSGGGKTTVTIALMKALMDRGYDIQGYKVGPDYIDSAFHKSIVGKSSRNLDIYLMGEDGVKESYIRGSGDLGVIEGVMGLYDGKGINAEYSTAHLAKTLDLPIVLVLTPKAQSVTLCAEIEGLRNFGSANIVGVILNNIGGGYYRLLKKAIEENCKGITVFGYVPKDHRIELKSRHLGLVQSSEVEDLNEKIEVAKNLLEENVDLDELIKAFRVANIDIETDSKFHMDNKKLKIAVARDKAFNFYYKENLELLSELGEITYFSPLEDDNLPENIDFLYIGGGYPEIFKEELSKNKSMLHSIKEALDSGLRCYAECGGLMYLSQSIDDFPMVGFLKGRSYMTEKLNNFGYAEINVYKENQILWKDMKIKCHEFHKSLVNLQEDNIYEVSKELYDGTNKKWNCGYIKNNTLAAYGHIHFFSNLRFLEELTK